MFDTVDFKFRGLGFKQLIDSQVRAFTTAELAVQNDDLRDVVDDVSVLVFIQSKRVRDLVLILDKHDGPNVVDREIDGTAGDEKSHHLLLLFACFITSSVVFASKSSSTQRLLLG